jgi:acyl-CoA synthetase (AMP-forming)/AMP-acid ligase II
MGNNSAYACLQWACASIGAILVTINPAYRLPEFVDTLKLVGVSHLFIVPRIRTSHYTFLLSGAFPALRDSSPGNIQEAALPELRNLVVVNNAADPAEFRKDLHGLKSAIDWRETLVWREDAKEKKSYEETSKSLHKDDLALQRYNWLAEGSISMFLLSLLSLQVLTSF